MKFLLLFLLIPLISFSQKPNEFWVTPVANIEFGEERIIYSYSMDKCINFTNLYPVCYSGAIMEMIGVRGTGCISDYQDMLNQIYSYIENWYINVACNKDKYNYLKAVCLLTIWDYPGKNILPSDTRETLNYLKDDLSIEIAKATKQTLDLIDFYENK